MILVRPELSRAEQKSIGEAVPFQLCIEVIAGRELRGVDPFRNDVDLLSRNFGEVGQQILFNEMAARLEVTGVPRTQTVSDFPTQPPVPAKEFRVMKMLIVMHRQYRRLAAVKALQDNGWGVDDIRLIHLFLYISKNQIAGSPVERSAK